MSFIQSNTFGGGARQTNVPAGRNYVPKALSEAIMPGEDFDKKTSVTEDKSGKQAIIPALTHPDQLGTLDSHWIDVDEMLLWLSIYDRDHPACRKAQREETGGAINRPLWLIDIQLECIVPAEGVHNEYIALSYVWGGVESAQLTHETFTTLQRPGALGNEDKPGAAVVPKTIHHAMGLVGLKQRYLWVDPFCICQEDAKSKHSQLQAMADIYDGAYLTIVAASGRDVDYGLHGLKGVTESRTLYPHMDHRNYWRLVNPNWSVWVGIISQTSGNCGHYTNFFHHQYSRGWTFQEAVFSREESGTHEGMGR